MYPTLVPELYIVGIVQGYGSRFCGVRWNKNNEKDRIMEETMRDKEMTQEEVEEL